MRFLIIIGFGIAALFGLPGTAAAQINQQCPHIEPLLQQQERRDRRSAVTVREQLIKLCIQENKKDFEKLIERTEEIAKLSGELQTSFDENKSLSKDDKQKLKRVEKLVKKVRSELRASGDDEDKELPQDVVEALKLLQESASNLVSEIKKTTRHSVSLVAIKTSNTVMSIVKFLRFGN
ncbi:MAG: hypothetical protein HKN33_12040 [Pyrinomonadaceae bacterium]|nr:hypothetical protein [Pyrinomonadaceae bacterium]